MHKVDFYALDAAGQGREGGGEVSIGRAFLLSYSFDLDDAGIGRHWEGFGWWGGGALGKLNVHGVCEGGLG